MIAGELEDMRFISQPFPNEVCVTTEDSRGSITPLIIIYFTVAMLLIFVVSNVAAAYVARRDLTNRVEASLLRAAQEIDEFKYYYGGPTTEFLAQLAIEEGKLLVPIDCATAARTFRNSLTIYSKSKDPFTNKDGDAQRNPIPSLNKSENLNPRELNSDNRDTENSDKLVSGKPEIKSFDCEGNRISALVAERFELPFRIPVLGITTFENSVEASADSVYE